MKKAVFMDYMGTIVTENSRFSANVVKECFEGSSARTPDEVFGFWFMEHDRRLKESFGETFQPEYEIALQTFQAANERFKGTKDPEALCKMLTEHWMYSPAFDDVKKFFKKCPVPIYLVTNNDTRYLEEGIKNTGISPAGMITSEMAKAYKPREEIFRMALEKSGCRPDEVLHVGDSLHGDIEGAKAAGIEPRMILRDGRKPVSGVLYIEGLTELLGELK